MREFLTQITFPKVLVLTVIGAAYIGMMTDVPRKRATTQPQVHRPIVPHPGRSLPAPPRELKMAAVSIPQPAQVDVDVAPLTVWRGSLPASHDGNPDGRVVTDRQTWRDVWNRLRGTEPPPEVDFTRDVIVLGTLPGSNLATVKVWRDPRGRIRLSILGTKTSKAGGSYVLARFDRIQVGRAKSPKPIPKKSDG